MALLLPDVGVPTYDGQAIGDSTDLAAMVAQAAGTGIIYGGDAPTAQHTGSDMNVSVAADACRIGGIVESWTAATVAVSAASATDRKDILVYTIGTGLQVIAGTACGTSGWTKSNNPATNPPPNKPAIPATSVLVTEIYVPGGVTGITNAMLTDKTPIIGSDGLGVYGDGSDGAATCDGSTVVAGMTLSGGNYTVNRDVFFTTLTVNTGVVVITNAYRVFVQGVLNLAGTGQISWNGTGGGAGGTGSAAVGNTNGTISNNASVSAAGGNGGTGTGTSGNGTTQTLGGAGGHGGQGTSPSNGATGGTATAPTATYGLPRAIPLAVIGMLLQGVGTLGLLRGGAGGGGGGGDTVNSGGGGGSGGGIVMVAAQFIIGSGTIQAKGGNGGTPTVGNTGGGGGGGGGLVIVVSSGIAPTVTTSALGGTLGTAHGSGTNASGTNGSAGTVITLPN